MDDTNPTKEDIEYVESIQADVNWLIGGWADDRLGLKPKGKTPETIARTANGIFISRPSRNIGNRKPRNRDGGSNHFTPAIISTRFTTTPSS